MYSPKAIANWFIERANKSGVDLSPMKLLKLVYLAHGWNLALTDKPLINEAVCAWRFGPVISSLYQEFKHFGNEQVTEFALNPITKQPYEVLAEDEKTQFILNKVWEWYAPWSAIQLSNLTHDTGSPWDIAWNEEKGSTQKGYIVRDELIRNHYHKLAMEAMKAAS